MNLGCDEKILTGEGIIVTKVVSLNIVDGDEICVGVGQRHNMAYSSSTVTKGRGTVGVVVFMGLFPEIGKMAESMQGKTHKANSSISRDEGSLQPVRGAMLRVWDGVGAFLGLTTGTPLQRKLSNFAYSLIGCALILAITVFGVNKVAIYAISTEGALPR